MKTTIRKAHIALTTLLWVLMAYGCGQSDGYGQDAFLHIRHEETAALADNDASPYLDFSIDYTCLNEEDDSIARLINGIIQREFLGDDYADLAPRIAVDSFKNTFIREYRNETAPLYQADLQKNGEEGTMPPWYSKTYSVVTFVEEGWAGMVNATANYFDDQGGAHPNQWSRWMNFSLATGKLLTLQDVFDASARENIERILLDKLILRTRNEYPDETLNTIEDLQRKGFLQMTSIYIPDNFLLSKRGVLFLFNRYDIAPYSEGKIVLEVPYEEIGQWIRNWK